MAAYNCFTCVGRVCQDPQFGNTTAKGTAFLKFDIAVDRQGGQDAGTDFVHVILWGKRAEALKDYIKKGRTVLVSGPNLSNNWEDQDGKKRRDWTLHANNDFQFLDKAPRSGEEEAAPADEVPTSDEELWPEE